MKVLPDLFAPDPDRLARFEREAQVLASLNDVSSDGRFLINVTSEDAATSPITLLLNGKPPATP